MAPGREPIRSILLTGSLGPGGTELAVMTLARSFADRRVVDPHVVVLTSGGKWADGLRAGGIRVSELGIAGPIRRPVELRKLLSLVGIVRREKIDIVHTFLFDADVYGMLATRLGRPRAVITTRRAIKANRPHHLRAYSWTNRFANKVVANSEAVARFTIENEKIRAEKVIVIPNGVSIARFRSGDRYAMRERLGIRDDEILVGSIGTLKPVKGQQVFAQAILPMMRERLDLRVVFAGTRTRGYGDEIERMISDAGMQERALLPGSVEEVPDLLAALDLFVMPSLSEGMSNALLEAMAAGLPIIATSVGGNSENLEHGKAGHLVPPDDSAALAEAIERMLDDRNARNEFAARASHRAESIYSLESMLDSTESLYRSLL